MFEENKIVEIRRMLLKAVGKSFSPYYYLLSINYAKKLLKSESDFPSVRIKTKPCKTLAIV